MLERVRGDDYKIQLPGRTKMYHANMLKKYWIREHEELNAMVIEPEEREEDEMNLFTSLQTETYRDVRINPELTEEQRDVGVKFLEEFQDVFTDVPGLTDLGEHSITLTTEEPIYSKPYLLLHG